MAEPQPHDSDYEVDPTSARLDLLSAYTMRGTLELDGLLSHQTGPWAEEVAAVVEPPALEDDGSYFYKAPDENAWTAA